MQFDNRGFESGVNSTLNSLKRLSDKLKFSESVKGMDGISEGFKKLSPAISGIDADVGAIASRFSNLGIIGAAALFKISNAVMSLGSNMAKSFTIDPILDGLNEYELKMNSIQTILTNTRAHGTGLKEVNAALSELNDYSDKTIYNFAQMTDNIGKATAAGLKLDDAVTFVKGMSNAAAGFGVDATRMAGATYQMTQALAAGVVQLQDWNSLQQAGMGGKPMQDEMIKVAEGMGIVVDKSKPFRETLKDGWLTSEVFIKAMENMANDPALTAAATNVTTLTKLLDTLKEAIGSGWATSFEHIFGDKDQSTKLWTDINNTLSDIISKSADARNEVLKGWSKGGGRDAMIKGFSNIFSGHGGGR